MKVSRHLDPKYPVSIQYQQVCHSLWLRVPSGLESKLSNTQDSQTCQSAVKYVNQDGNAMYTVLSMLGTSSQVSS